MRLKKDLVLRKVAGQFVVVPIGRLSQISPVMNISSSAAWMWEIMKDTDFTTDMLVEKVVEHFSGVTEEVARRDVENFMELLDKNYMLDNGKSEPLMGRVKVELTKEQAERLRRQDANANE